MSNKSFSEKLKDLVEKAKVLLAFEEAPAEGGEPTTEEGQFTLADGTIIKADAIEVGMPVVLVTAEGEIPAPEGNHTLEDGRTISVDATGVITAIAEAPAAAPEGAPETEVAMSAVEIRELVEKTIEAKFSALIAEKDEKIAAIEKANNSLIEQHKKTTLAFSELLSVVQEIGEATPAPITEQKASEKPNPLGYFKK